MHGTVHFKRTYGVFVLVSVKPGVYNTTKQILEQRLQYIQDSNARTLKYPMYKQVLKIPGKSWPTPARSSSHGELQQRQSSGGPA